MNDEHKEQFQFRSLRLQISGGRRWNYVNKENGETRKLNKRRIVLPVWRGIGSAPAGAVQTNVLQKVFVVKLCVGVPILCEQLLYLRYGTKI